MAVVALVFAILAHDGILKRDVIHGRTLRDKGQKALNAGLLYLTLSAACAYGGWRLFRAESDD